jgi:1-acyl-sn-glycerol-3-phosphate acyltransferase
MRIQNKGEILLVKSSPLWITIRSLCIWAVSVFVLLSISFIAVLSYPFHMQNFVHFLSRIFAKIMIFVSGVRFEITGREKLYRSGPIIIVSNHQSMFDAIGMYTFLDIPFRWVAKASLFRIPIFGLALKSAGYIPVERNDPKKAVKSLFEAARDIHNGMSVAIFPEGTRSNNDGTMKPFKNGSFLLARKAKVVIQPVTFWGSHLIIPVNKKNWFQKVYPGKVSIIVHDPIFPDVYKDFSVDEISNYIRVIMEKSLSAMKSENAT